jgi:BirA family biotin operon repressor/biotin-[acetyl-CoA-carboxylase] ligase
VVIPFSPALFQQLLTTEAVGRFLLYRLSTETTMTIARREAEEGAPHGTLVLAEEQTAGRGRRGRSFASPAGENLYFTLVLRPSLDVHRRLPVILPVALCASICSEGLDARIKWPNDIWVGDRKLSGMLIDAELQPGGPIAMPGIGINVNGDPTVIPELAATATSIRRELGRTVVREALLARICNELEQLLAGPAADVSGRYIEFSMIIGREVIVTPTNSGPYTATAEAIDEDGSLIVVRGNGARETLTAADVSLRPAG